MTLKHYLLTALAATLLCWGAWLVVLWNINPFLSGAAGLASFYITILLALIGTLSLLGIMFRKAFSTKPVSLQNIGEAVRQGVFLAVIVVGALALRGAEVYTWWALTLLIAGFTVLEFFFLSRESA